MAAFMAGSSVSVGLSSQIISDLVASPSSASATYRLRSNGTIEQTTNSGGTVPILPNWIVPTSAAGAAYECRATVTSGALSTGTAGSWLSLGSDQAWSRTQTTNGLSTVVMTVEIRNATTLGVLATATITLSAERTP